MIPEMVNQVAFEVIGNDVTITMAAEAGQLQLNAFEPVIAYSMLRSPTHLRAACDALATRCVRGITANRDRMARMVSHSAGLVTALSPYIGYVASTEIAQEALLTGSDIGSLALARGLISAEQLAEALDPDALTGRLRVAGSGL